MPLSAWSQNGAGAGAGMLISICQHLYADLMLAYADLIFAGCGGMFYINSVYCENYGTKNVRVF